MPVLKLLALLLRPKTNYQVPVTDKLQRALDTMQAALQQQNHELAVKKLHTVFMALWMHKWLPTKQNSIPCPTVRALALITMKLDGHFAEPHGVTPYIAKFE